MTVEELSKMEESSYRSFVHDMVHKLEMCQKEESEFMRIAEIYLDEMQE